MRFTSRAKSKIRSWNIGRTSRNQKFADATAAKHPTQSVAKCRAQGHTPSHGRKRNQRTTQSSKVFNRTGVGAYRIRPPRGRKRNQRTTQSSKEFNRTGVGAYRIRPHVGEPRNPTAASTDDAADFSRTSGRMPLRPYSFPDGKQIHYNPIKRLFLTGNTTPMKGLPIKNRSLETPELFRFCFQ